MYFQILIIKVKTNFPIWNKKLIMLVRKLMIDFPLLVRKLMMDLLDLKFFYQHYSKNNFKQKKKKNKMNSKFLRDIDFQVLQS